MLCPTTMHQEASSPTTNDSAAQCPDSTHRPYRKATTQSWTPPNYSTWRAPRSTSHLSAHLQWVIQIGRFDITTAVMTLSRFRAAPRQGHLDRVKRIFGYLSKMRHATIRIRTGEPDFSQYPEQFFDWQHTCHWGAEELIPDDAPEPKGKCVVFSSFVDANLFHDLISGQSVTGVFHFVNKTPIDWYSKLQSTVETATFGSEFVAARTCTEQVIDLRLTFRYLGVPVRGATMMFGDNKISCQRRSSSLTRNCTSDTMPSLTTRQERVLQVAAGITRFYHIKGSANPADILSKHWDCPFGVGSPAAHPLLEGRHRQSAEGQA